MALQGMLVLKCYKNIVYNQIQVKISHNDSTKSSLFKSDSDVYHYFFFSLH